MVSATTPDLLISSRDSTPTPPAGLRPTDQNRPSHLAAKQGFYAPRLEEVHHSLNSTVPSASSRASPSTEHLAWLVPGDAKPDQVPSLTMPEMQQQPPSYSDSGRIPVTSSRSDSRSQSRSNFTRRRSYSSSSQAPHPRSSAVASSTSSDASVTLPSSQYQTFMLPQYHSPPPYGPAGGYVGHYTASRPQHMSPPHAYIHPHGFNPQEMSQNPHVGYSVSPPMMSMIQSPVYQFQGQQTSEGSSSASCHSFSNAGPINLYTHMNPSPPPHSPPGGPPHHTSYSSPTTYAPMRYSPSQHFTYSGQSYHSSNLYQSAYAQQEGQSPWWYLPHSGRSDSIQPQFHQGHFQMRFPPMPNLEIEPYNQTGPCSQSPYQHQHQFSSPQSASESRDKSSALPPAMALSGSPSVGTESKLDSSIPPTSSKERSHSVRRAYHPNPPSQRSEWVMWAGNVPSDATHDELWRFFTQAPKLGTSASTEVSGGVSSIFLISRSNCAFVNFESENNLQVAIARFSGHQMRPGDAKCPHLVCRVRRKDDDLKAGVGGQRGVELHTKWVRQHKGEAATEGAEDEATTPEVFGPSNDEGENASPRHTSTHSNSSGSYASTNSSLLTRYFPRRYFILKSLNQFDLDLSVERGVWATQPHNEGILDQAFRTSKHVYLIFGVNKSGEFYGYARMTGPISRSETKVPWASRTDSPASPRSSRSSLIFSPSERRFAESSPQPVSPEAGKVTTRPAEPRQDRNSAPAELHQLHAKFSLNTPEPMISLDQKRLARASPHEDFRLDSNAPIRALRHPQTSPTSSNIEDRSRELISEPRLEALLEEDERQGQDAQEKEKEKDDANQSWGKPFKIEWINTERLPFYRTRNLRNPWNHDREIKVSRDGTELESTVGQALLDEWNRPRDPSSPSRTPASSKRESKNKTGLASQKGKKREGATA